MPGPRNPQPVLDDATVPEERRLRLLETAMEQGGVVTRAQARAALGRAGLDRAMRAGAWVSLTHGVLTTGALHAATADDPVRRHLLLGAGRLTRTAEEAWLSHESAALVYELPLWKPVEGNPRITVEGPSPRTATHRSGRHVAPVPLAQRSVVRGLAVTSAARTVADLCRTPDEYAAAVVADGALAKGLDRAEVLAVLAACRHWPHVIAARATVALASPWSESPLESLALVWCRRQGLPRPQQQITIRRADGRFLARSDLVWEQHRTVGEVDGKVKYTDATVLWREKLREDELRETGLEVVRGFWSDAADGGADFAMRVRRAFARAARRPDPLSCRLIDERDHARGGPLAA